jgi:NFU1 iron-sulfur cluster scaffold homolog, mitochondrial
MSDAVGVDAPIAIRAEISVADPDTCKFTLGQALDLVGERFFANREQAAGSPLIERLFELPGVAHVLVAGCVLAVGKTSSASWPELKPDIAAVVRSQLRSGVPAILEAPASSGLNGRSDAEIRLLVQALLDREVNPSVAAHGGAIALTEVRDAILYIEMTGGCQGCAGSQVTLRQGFERMVRRVAPEVIEIVDVTDHSGGRTPYYGGPAGAPRA